MTIVLHACCGPCASACVPRLKDAGHDVTLLFANSNIDTPAEFARRREAARRLAEHDGVAFAEIPYDHADWLEKVAKGFENEPEKGARCARCFRYSLEQAAAWARANGRDAFTTSLTVSPHKSSAHVFAAGEAAQGDAPPPAFLHEDFKKREGFKLSVARSKELGLYRQDYCGCEFSRGNRKEF